ncbi:hypothetical protein HDU77_009830 [Chytriomyces hyalinus]|nr:hypothetical protein HDU77_009830 [Chytriomyces hyalinus]
MAPAPQVLQLEMGGVEAEVEKVANVFAVKESEETWTARDDALARLSAVSRGSAHHSGFVACVRRLKQPLLDALNTDRTRLARTALTLCEVLSVSLLDRFDGLADFLLPALIRLSTRSNKVIVTCATSALMTIIDNSGVPSIIPMLAEHVVLPSPSKSLRICAAECLNRVLESSTATSKLDKYVESVENTIKSGTVDSAPEVRGLIRTAFDSYKDRFPSRLERFIASLPDVTAKYLKVSKTGSINSSISSTINRKTLLRPRVPTASSSTSSNLIRSQSMSRASSATPDSYARGADFADEEESHTLDSETPSFALEGDDAGSAKLATRQPLLSLKQPSIRDAPKQQSIRPPESDAFSNTLVGARRLLVTQPFHHLGGAQRILREGKSALAVPEKSAAILHTMPKAMRVPAAMVAPSAEHASRVVYQEHSAAPIRAAITAATATSSAIAPSASSSTTSQKESKIPQKANSLVAKSASLSRKPENIDLADVTTKLKSSDWSTRYKAWESISLHMSSASAAAVPASLASDMRMKASRYCSILLSGLNDNNHKCATASMQGIVALFDGSYGAIEMVETVIPRIAALVFYQPAKTKAPLLELGQGLIVGLVEKFGVDACAVACVHALNHPEFVKVVKVRGGCLAMLAELSDDEWNAVLNKPTSMKLYMTRIVSQVSDADAIIQKSVKVCLSALYSFSADAFFTCWAAAKPAEKKAVNALFHTSDIGYSGKELEAAKKVAGGISTPGAIYSVGQTSPSVQLSHFRFGTTSPNSVASKTPRSRAATSMSIYGRDDDFESQSLYAQRNSHVRDPEHLTFHQKRELFGGESENERTAISGVIKSSSVKVSPKARVQDERNTKTSTNRSVKSPILTPTITRSVSSFGTRSDRIGISASASKMVARSGIPLMTNTVPRVASLASKLPSPSLNIGRIPVMSRPHSRQSKALSPNMTRTTNFASNSRSPVESPGQATPLKRFHRNGRLTSPVNLNDSEMASMTPPPLPPAPAAQSMLRAPNSATSKSGEQLLKHRSDPSEYIRPFSEPQEDPDTRFQRALKSSMDELALFVFDGNNAAFVRKELSQILEKVFVYARALGDEASDIRATKNTVLILKYIVQTYDMKSRLSDILLALLCFDSKSYVSSEEHLELEFELDSILSILKKFYAPELLLKTAADCLEHPLLVNLSLRPTLCFELAGYAIETLENFQSDSDSWKRVIGFIASGLGSGNMHVRKSAFGCTVALGKRSEGLVNSLYEEVGARNGPGREGVIRGMLQRHLGR